MGNNKKDEKIAKEMAKASIESGKNYVKYGLPATLIVGGLLAAASKKPTRKRYGTRKDYQQPRKVDLGRIRKPNLFD